MNDCLTGVVTQVCAYLMRLLRMTSTGSQMRLSPPISGVVLAVALAACSTARVTVERDAAQPLPMNSTYAWQRADRSAAVAGESDMLVNNDIIHRRVQAEIDTVLAHHRWRQRETDSAQFLVQYNIGRRIARSTYTTTNYGYGAVPVLRCGPRHCWSYWGWGTYGMPVATTRAYAYPEGTLLIDLIDRRSGELVFRGIGTEVLEMKDLDQDRLEREIARILQSVPGQSE